MIETAFFYLFAGTLIGSAAMVVLGRNPIHSVLFLILAFLNAAGLFLLAGAEFLAMVLVIVYVGAVAVLFLFLIMMLDVNGREISKGLTKYALLGSVVGLILAGELITVSVLWVSHPKAEKAAQPAFETLSNAHAIGQILYTDYAYIFQLSGIILLVAMVGAITLTLRPPPFTRRQTYQGQARRSAPHSVTFVKVNSRQGVSLGVKQ